MGKNLPAKKYKVGNPTTRKLRFVWDAGPAGNTVSFDLAKSLSALNSRSYAQGLYYYVNSVTVHNTGGCSFIFSTAPDTWVTRAAYKRAKAKWDKMNAQAANGSGKAIYPKWHDFKIQLQNGETTLEPRNAVGTPSPINYTNDEWALSKFVTQDPDMSGATPGDVHNADEFTAHLLGGHQGTAGAYTSLGIIRSYTDTRGRNTDDTPNFSSAMETDPLATMFDPAGVFDEIRENLDEDNDRAPYNADGHAGASSAGDLFLVEQAATGDGGGAMSRTGGFRVPFGLLKCTTAASGATEVNSVSICIEVAAGPYHGVYAENP